MKKNIIIAILSTILITFVVLIIIGLSIENKDKGSQEGMRVFKDAYVGGCTEDGVATLSQCTCAYDNMLEVYGEDGFLQMAAKYSEDEEMPSKALKAVLPCFSK